VGARNRCSRKTWIMSLNLRDRLPSRMKPKKSQTLKRTQNL
jgi:hypothetical protein